MPDYKRIFSDMLELKYSEKKPVCKAYLNKKNLTQLDVLKVSELIRGSNHYGTKSFNQKHKAYNPETIRKILKYQKEYELNDSEVARHFKMSRNTLYKWKNLEQFEII